MLYNKLHYWDSPGGLWGVPRIKSGTHYTTAVSPTIYGCSQLSFATLLHTRSRAIAFPILWGCQHIESFSKCQGRGFGLWVVITILCVFMQKVFLPRGETIRSTISEWFTASFCILNTSITKLPDKSERHRHSLGIMFLNVNSHWLVGTRSLLLSYFLHLILTKSWILPFSHWFIQWKFIKYFYLSGCRNIIMNKTLSRFYWTYIRPSEGDEPYVHSVSFFALYNNLKLTETLRRRQSRHYYSNVVFWR